MFNTHHNKRWQHRPQLYRGRFLHLRTLALSALWLLLALLVVATFIFFRNSEALSLRHVKISGSHSFLADTDILALAGVVLEQNLVTINLDHMKAGIERHPWVEQATLRRSFPDTLEITVRERTPVALLFAEKFYLIDASGKVFAAWHEGLPLDLPIISGFDAGDLRRFPQYFAQELKDCVSHLIYLSSRSVFKSDPISELRFDPGTGISVFTRNRGIEIHYGSGDLEDKQSRLEKFVASREFTRTAYVRVDLDMAQKIVARKY